MSKYRITIKSVLGNVLTYTVDVYPPVEDGHFKFIDQKTNLLKSFPVENCEIQEVQ